MTQPPSTEDNASNPANPPAQPPAQPPSQPSTPHQGGNGPGPGSQLLDAINALPERITMSIREALTPPRAPAATPPGNPASSAQSATAANSPQDNNSPGNKQGSESTSDKATATPGKKTFAEWWFKG